MVSPHRHTSLSLSLTLSLSLSLTRSIVPTLSLLLLTLRWRLGLSQRVTVEGRPIYDTFKNISNIVCAEWAKLNGQSPPPECAGFLAA